MPPAVVLNREVSSLPPVPDHDFIEGDRVEMPLHGRRTIVGTIRHIDVKVGSKQYLGLAVLGDDGLYYEFHPEIARKR